MVAEEKTLSLLPSKNIYNKYCERFPCVLRQALLDSSFCTILVAFIGDLAKSTGFLLVVKFCRFYLATPVALVVALCKAEEVTLRILHSIEFFLSRAKSILHHFC